MALTKQQFLDTLTQIGTCEDETQRRDMLATLNTEATSIFDSNETLTQQNQTLTNDNETLRTANMKLFLQVGSNNGSGEGSNNNNSGNQEEPRKRIKYEDLFDEKGGLK